MTTDVWTISPEMMPKPIPSPAMASNCFTYSERRYPSALSKFDDIKADDGSRSPNFEDLYSAYRTNIEDQYSASRTELAKYILFRKPARGFLLMIDAIESRYRRDSEMDLRYRRDSEWKCPSALSLFDERRTDYGSLSTMDLVSDFKTEMENEFLPRINERSCFSVSSKFDEKKADYGSLSIMDLVSDLKTEMENEFLPRINEIYNFLLEKTKLIPVCKVENYRLCLSVSFRCMEEKRLSGLTEEVISELQIYPDLRVTQGRKWVQVSAVLPEKVMKQVTKPPPGMGAGSYSPRRRAVPNDNYKKLMCLIDQLSKTYRASSSFESMKEPSGANLSAGSDSERVQVSDDLPEEVVVQMPIPSPAMAVESCPPNQSGISIADYKKIMCLVDQLSKTYNALSSFESMKEPSRVNLSAGSDSERVQFSDVSPKEVVVQMPIPSPGIAAESYPPQQSAVSNADYKKIMCLVDQLSKTYKALSSFESMKEPSRANLSAGSDSEEEVVERMPIPPAAMAAESYPPPRSAVSVADYNKLMCLVDQLSKTYQALSWLESMKESSPTYLSANSSERVQVSNVLPEEVMIQMPIPPPVMGEKTVVFLDYVGTISPFVANFLSYADTSYADTSYAMNIVILFLISMITIIVYLFWLRSTTPPPLQDTTLNTTLGTWPNLVPQEVFADCCPICLDRFDDEQEGEDNTLRILWVCRHVFHARCVDRWLREHPTCPMCRWPVTLDEILHIFYN